VRLDGITTDTVLLGNARRADPVYERLLDVGSPRVRADTALALMPAAIRGILTDLARLFLHSHISLTVRLADVREANSSIRTFH